MQRQDKSTAETGIWGERQAERLLKSKGYKILGKRFADKAIELINRKK